MFFFFTYATANYGTLAYWWKYSQKIPNHNPLRKLVKVIGCCNREGSTSLGIMSCKNGCFCWLVIILHNYREKDVYGARQTNLPGKETDLRDCSFYNTNSCSETSINVLIWKVGIIITTMQDSYENRIWNDIFKVPGFISLKLKTLENEVF